MHSYFGLGDEPFRSAQCQKQFIPLMSVASWWGHIFSRQSTAQQRKNKLVPDVEREKNNLPAYLNSLIPQLSLCLLPCISSALAIAAPPRPQHPPAGSEVPSSLLIISMLLLLFYTRVTWPSKVAAHNIVNKNSYTVCGSSSSLRTQSEIKDIPSQAVSIKNMYA